MSLTISDLCTITSIGAQNNEPVLIQLTSYKDSSQFVCQYQYLGVALPLVTHTVCQTVTPKGIFMSVLTHQVGSVVM